MDKENVIKAAKICLEHFDEDYPHKGCDKCPSMTIKDAEGTGCFYNFITFIVDYFDGQEILEKAVETYERTKRTCASHNPLLTRWDAEKPPEKIDRAYILDTAKRMVTGKREQDYGSPEDNFKLIGDMWSAYCGVPIGAMDVAAMMAILKIARIGTGTATDDSWIDLAGYAACGGEIACK